MDLLHTELDRSERIFDLVSEPARHLLPGADALQVLDARAARLHLEQHAVERLGKLADFVVARLADANREVTAAHARRRASELAEPYRNAARQKRAHQKRAHHREPEQR